MVRKLVTRIPGKKKKKIEAECTTSEVEKLERVKKDNGRPDYKPMQGFWLLHLFRWNAYRGN